MALEPLTPAQIVKAAAWLETWQRVGEPDPSLPDDDSGAELRAFVVRRRMDGVAVVTAHSIDPVACETCGGFDPEGGVVPLNPDAPPHDVDTDDCPDHRPRRTLMTTTNFYAADGWICDERGVRL